MSQESDNGILENSIKKKRPNNSLCYKQTEIKKIKIILGIKTALHCIQRNYCKSDYCLIGYYINTFQLTYKTGIIITLPTDSGHKGTKQPAIINSKKKVDIKKLV